MMSPANSGMPVFSTPGFQPLSGVTKPEVQAAHGNRFGVVPSPAGPWQPQINGVPASSVYGAQHNAGAPLVPANASPFPQQFSRPPSSASPVPGLQNATFTPALVGPAHLIRAQPLQV